MTPRCTCFGGRGEIKSLGVSFIPMAVLIGAKAVAVATAHARHKACLRNIIFLQLLEEVREQLFDDFQ